MKMTGLVEEGSGNVFADLGFRDARSLQLKAELTRQIYRRIRELKLTQARAAARMGLKQPDVSKLMAGRFTGFSVERLMGLLMALDTDVSIVLSLRATSNKQKRPSVRVVSEI